MANHSRERGQNGTRAGVSGFTEPEVRRWPHPIDGTISADVRSAASGVQTEVSLYYIHCALSYQNQLLAEIKTLLEQLTLDHSQNTEEK